MATCSPHLAAVSGRPIPLGRPPEPQAERPVIEGATREAPAHPSPGPDQPRPRPQRRRARLPCPVRARQPRAPAV